MEKVINKINMLKQELEGNFSIKRAETFLYEICDENDPVSIGLLIKLLDDHFEYDEFMFSIIHCIEKFESSVYVHHVLKSVPESIYKSPRWASILHMRILNAPDTLIAYIKEIKNNSTEDQKKSIGHLLNSINKVSPEFMVKTLPLSVVCKM